MKPHQDPPSWSPISRRLLQCHAGGEDYLLDMSHIGAIGRGQQIIPNQAATGPAGWIEFDGGRVPVYRLATTVSDSNELRRLNGEPGAFVVLNAEQRFALQVERIEGSMDAGPDQVIPLPAIAAGIFTDVVRLGEKWTLCADPMRCNPEAPAKQRQEAVIARRSIPPDQSRGVEGDDSKLRIVVFSAAGSPDGVSGGALQFALSVTQVKQVVEFTSAVRIPGAPAYVLGVADWRGIPVPVIDLPARLGMRSEVFDPSAGSSKSYLIIARSPGGPELAALLVNRPPRTCALPVAYSPPGKPLSVDPELIKGVFEMEGMPLVVPDLDVALTGHYEPHAIWL